jgi:pyruvate dehydrogenase E1 component
VASGRQRYSIISDGLPTQLPDIDPDETREWLDSFDSVTRTRGRGRARYLMLRLLERAREQQVGVPGLRSTDYINTISPEKEPWFPGDEYVERRIRAYIRWNAAIMVSRANRPGGAGVGGHIATYASAASLYEVGFNHFFRGKDHGESGDQVFFQGHAAPGIYARAFLEGRLTEGQLDGFRQELSSPGGGLPSYPHPRLMPDFWEFPTVSMGLGPLNAIYQARFNRYLLARELHDTSRSHVWAFLGDGEMDEPEALGAIGLAAREELDNLTFVINCNLQRLDGPVRGNGKIIQELESFFRGAGWNVIKVIWGRDWDPLLAQDTDGVLVNKMNTTPDGQFQTYSVESGAYIREHFFGDDPRLRKIVEHLSDDELRNLSRGGHDYRKVYAAFKAAREHVGQPTVILTHTIKGWTLGKDFEARNATHQMKKLTHDELKEFRDRLPADPGQRAGKRASAVLPPGSRFRRDPVHEGTPRRSRRGAAAPRRPRQAAAAAAGLGVQRVPQGLGQAVRGDHDGVRPDPQGPDEGPGHRRPVRPGHPGRGPHVRHGLAFPDREDLLPVRADLRGRRPQPAAVVQGVRARPDAARGHLRGGRDGVGDRRRDVVRHARDAHDPGVRVLLDVRLAADG